MTTTTPPALTHSPRENRDQHVAIVGGGTAGWMAAATLRRRLGCAVTLIESSNAPGVGVGEATIPAMIDWLDNMGIDEEEFLRRTGGTYKLAIRFDDWVTANHRYWHPFGVCGASIDGIDLVHFWKRGRDEGWLEPSTEYTAYSLQRLLCEHERSPRTLDSSSKLENYAYHLDAGKLANFIREIAIDEGVTHRIGDVVGATVGHANEIQQVNVAGHAPIVADLYLDCSGFASVLIEQSLHVPWIDWSDMLLCDRAVVVRVPRRNDGLSQDSVSPYTISTGLSAGWAWQIPLRDNIGAGYVYSSRHTTPQQARHELLQHVNLDANTPTRELAMRVGYRQQSWTGNCISLGLASGFVEPLESTGIFLVQRALDELVDCLPPSPNSEPRRDIFNARMRTAYEEVRDFVLLHYVISKRDDTAFWRDARNVTLPDSLAESMHRYTEHGEVMLPPRDPVFAEANHHFIMAGAGHYPATHARLQHASLNPRVAASVLEHLRQHNAFTAQQMLRHRDLLSHIHQPSFETCFS